ncbi:MAG: Tat pathway signal protein [Acetobacteraceae bacterium]|nr:Tat pathway signal protein [Acetobacteraceae bacterium]
MCLGALPLGASAAPASAGAPITLQLNKLEPLSEGGPGCRVFFVVSNPDATAIQQFTLDLVLFGTNGVIARRLALDLGPLSSRKTSVRLFDLKGLPCDDIGQVLVNGVLACQTGAESQTSQITANEQRQACLDRLGLSSLAKASLTK